MNAPAGRTACKAELITVPGQRRIMLRLILLYGLLCTAGAMLIPPLQSPDEPAHLGRAYLLAHGQWLLEPSSTIGSGGPVDTGFIAYVEAYAPLSMDIGQKLTPDLIAAASAIRWSGQRERRAAPGTAYYFPLIYLPQAIGLGLGESLGYTVDTSVRLARIASVACSVWLLSMTALLMPIPLLVFALLSLPMTLFQTSCAGIDGVATAATVLCLSAFWRLRTAPAQHRLLFALIGAAALVGSCRQHLFVLLPLALLRAHQSRNSVARIACILLICLVVAWNIHAALHTIDLRVAQVPPLLARLREPEAFVLSLCRTLTNLPTLSLLATSFIGKLGWLNLHLPKSAYVAIGGYIAAHFAIAARNCAWYRAINDRCWLLLAAVTSALIVFFALWATWTPADAPLISGLQGRYFLGPALLVAYAAAPAVETPATLRMTRTGWVTICAFMAASAAVTALAITARYFGYTPW